MTERNPGLYGSVISWEDLPATHVRPGVTRRVYSTDELMICHHELELGMTTNPHTHEDFDQLVHIAAGRANYYVDGVSHDLRAGSFLLVPRGAVHYVEPIEVPCINIDYFVPPRQDLLPEDGRVS